MSRYESEYFDWQKNSGAFGGMLNRHKFERYNKSTDRVLDYGCGGGFLLHNIGCAEKIGIEINPVAREQAAELDIKAVEEVRDVPNDWADVIISNHAIEHTRHSLKELQSLHRMHGSATI